MNQRQQKTIEITVLPNGESRIETTGFTGAECREASGFLERALGRVSSDRLTAEFFTESAAKQEELERD